MESTFDFMQPESKEINLMEDQKKAVIKILNLNSALPEDDSLEYKQKAHYDEFGLDEEIEINGVKVDKQIFCFKALIIDDATQMMLSTITKMTDLREWNITFHSKINKKRDTIRDTPVIYLVEPTEENISKIIEDAEKALYDFIFFAFTKPISNSSIENLALKFSKLNAAEKVMKMQENYLSFYSHTPSCFTLYREKTYASLVISRSQQAALDNEIQNIVHGLFSIFEWTNFYPVIRFRKDDISETIAYELNSLFQEKAEREEQQFGYKRQPRQKKRCVLLIFNRDMDWSIMLRHSWSYLPLIHDLIGINSNQIKIKEEGKDKSYDLDFLQDPILEEYALKEIPELGENIDKKLQEWKLKYDEMNSKAQTQEVTQIFSNLNSVLDSLPKIKQEREKIEAHSSICTNLFDSVKQRDIDSFHELEEELITKAHLSSKTKKELEEILFNLNSSPKAGLDRLRLFCIYIMSSNPNKSEVRSKIQKLKELFPDTNFDLAFKIWKKLNPNEDVGNEETETAGFDDNNKSIFRGIASSVKDRGKSLWGNVKSLVENQTSDSLIANLIHQYYDTRGEHKEFMNASYIDTLVNRELDSQRANNLIFETSNISNIVVYVAGGGSYYEYQKVIELESKIDKKIIYGCDYIYSPEGFVDELKTIHKNEQ